MPAGSGIADVKHNDDWKVRDWSYWWRRLASSWDFYISM